MRDFRREEKGKSNERGWRLMIFCVRATLGLRRPLIGILARLGVPVGGRVRRLRAVEGQSAPIPEEEAASEEEWEESGHVPFLLTVKGKQPHYFSIPNQDHLLHYQCRTLCQPKHIKIVFPLQPTWLLPVR